MNIHWKINKHSLQIVEYFSSKIKLELLKRDYSRRVRVLGTALIAMTFPESIDGLE